MKQNLQNQTSRSQNVENAVEGWSNPCVPPPLARGKATVTLYHVTSPTCWWSWGYYGTLGRVRLTYGDQVDLKLVNVPVYEDVDQYWKEYELTPQKFEAWAKESQAKMGVPIFTGYAKRALPKSAVPPVLATLAAYRQGQPQGDRFARAICRRFVVEGHDVDGEAELLSAAAESGLDLARFRKDLSDGPGLRTALHEQQHGLPNLPLGFYNLALQDDRGRTVVLDHAYEPEDVIASIEFLTEGRLRKNVPTDVVAFLRATGPAASREIARAFGWSPEDTAARLQALVADLEIENVTSAGSTLYAASA